MLKTKLRNQKGFTLIEIIAVLVILGILAAVAVPKFVGLQDEAKLKAVKGAVAEGVTTVSMAYAKLSLSNSTAPTGGAGATAVANKAKLEKPASTDFSYDFTGSGYDVNIVVSGKVGSSVAGVTSSKVWTILRP